MFFSNFDRKTHQHISRGDFFFKNFLSRFFSANLQNVFQCFPNKFFDNVFQIHFFIDFVFRTTISSLCIPWNFRTQRSAIGLSRRSRGSCTFCGPTSSFGSWFPASPAHPGRRANSPTSGTSTARNSSAGAPCSRTSWRENLQWKICHEKFTKNFQKNYKKIPKNFKKVSKKFQKISHRHPVTGQFSLWKFVKICGNLLEICWKFFGNFLMEFFWKWNLLKISWLWAHWTIFSPSTCTHFCRTPILSGSVSF